MSDILKINTVQSSYILEALGIKNTDEANRIISCTLSFIMYLKTGESLEFSGGSFNKIASDLIQIDSNLDPGNISDSLEKRRVIKIPL